MIFKNINVRLLLRVLFLFLTLCAASFVLVKQSPLYLLLLGPLVAWQLYGFIKSQTKTQAELDQFVEAVHYRDFSRYFDEKNAPAGLQSLRKGFNEINSTFKVISREKETQYQYLQKILELVDTGILSYDIETGEVGWMNDTLKRMLQLPYLKTIQSLARRDEMLYHDIASIKAGETRIATAQLEKSSFKILLSATAFQTGESKSKLIAFQNVNEALDETESRAWQKLLSVMTHEIMNSIAPISSLAETLKKRLATQDSHTIEDMELGIETIQRRSEGLLRFAETYRNLNRITTLNLQRVYVRELFANLYQLMLPTFEQKKIEMEIILRDTDIAFEADIALMEQVLINLIVNAIEALKEVPAPRIVLSAEQVDMKKMIIRVTDNGPGIAPEVLDKIFIPFFSTKKHGSGIGLSLCKQIVLLHKGTIQAQSVEGRGTQLMLQFS